MFIFSLSLLFIMSLLLLFIYMKNSIMVIIMLEVMSFMILLLAVFALAPAMKSSFVLLVFCMFILESVLGIVVLINLVTTTGVDYVSFSLLS